MGEERRSSCSRSGEEDGDAEWRAAIDSVSVVATSIKHGSDDLWHSSTRRANYEDEVEEQKPQALKHYQIKVHKLLDEILDKSIEVVTHAAHVPEKDPVTSDSGVRLFKRAPQGIVFDHVVNFNFVLTKKCIDLNEFLGPKTKPRIVQGDELDEKSNKFRKRVRFAAVDGSNVIAAARAASEKSLARLEAREAAAKAAAKREEERVAELKKIRGERWLPHCGPTG